ncbi:MAG: radical SAM protein [Thermodesulfobacteriota bacterium]|nr:radical SAM protein [Thermodesulfobacteriota bacterium]
MIPPPTYMALLADGRLGQRIAMARERLEACTLCPRQCTVNRLACKEGVCLTGEQAIVAGFNGHFGEEAPLVGRHGSGTIFFSFCNLKCRFCQNYEISHDGEGIEVTDAQLAGIMLQLQEQGCHNINLVTPSHVVPAILAAVKIAAENGLRLPLVYNSSGYDSVDTLKLLDGVVDIYMPDVKFADRQIAAETCDAPDYWEVAQAALREMHAQVGDLEINAHGIAQRGLLVRHLVLPHDLANTRTIMRFIARHISPRTYVNIMSQYRPCGQARTVKGLETPLTPEDYASAVEDAHAEGIYRLEGVDLDDAGG